MALLGVAILSWSLFHWLTVARPDRARLISDSAYYGDIARSLARRHGYIDRLVPPVQIAAFQAGPPHPSVAWSPLYPALVGMWFGLSGQERATGPMIVNALGFLLALVALYVLASVVLGRSLGWIPPLMMALSPGILGLATDGLTEGWFAAFVMLTVLFLLVPGRTGQHVAAAGLLLAMAQLTRVNALALAPVLAALAARPSPVPAPCEEAATHGGPAAGKAGTGESGTDTATAAAEHARLPLAHAAPARGGAAVILFLGLFLLTLLPWLLYRYDVFDSPFFELHRFNLLNNLGPWHGTDAFRSLHVPDPITYILHHPFEFTGKLFAGATKTGVLLSLSFLAPLELALIVVGVVVMLRKPLPRHAILAILALVAVQLALGWATLLDPRIWRPVGILLWIPLAAGAGSVARRLVPAWAPAGVALLVALVAVLPFGRSCLASYLQPDLGRARLTEEDSRSLGAWTALMVPAGESLMTDYEALVWYADRAIVWLPVDPSEVEPLRRWSGVRHALWQKAPGRGGEETWRRYFDRALADGSLHPIGELRLTSGTFVVGRWE